jgi:hypothetical protein
MYERAYLDDRRALRNDSVDAYPRASDYIDEGSARSSACSSGRDSIRARSSTHNWSKR